MRDGGHVLAGMQANCTEGSFAPKTEMIEAAGARFLDARESIGAAEFPSRGEQDGPWSCLASWKKGLEQDIGEGRGGIPGTRCEQRAGGARGVPHFLAGGRQCLLGVPDTQHCPRLSLQGHGHFEGGTILPISEP